MSTYRVRFVLALSAFLALAGCSDSIVSECDDTGNVPVRAQFGDIEQRVLGVSCATAGCHTGTSPASGLDLTPGRAYNQLVGVTSLNYPAQQRVEAGSSARSVLIGVLRRNLTPAMPPTGPIDGAVIDSIAAWIDAGAPNN